MQNAPARQPRVGPAVPRIDRAWFTPACLTAAIVLAGAVMLPPFAAGTLFPGRSVGSSAEEARPTGPVESIAAQPATPIAAVDQTNDEPDGNLEAKYGELPLAAEPANEPPRNPASEANRAGGTLATGVFASRIAPEAGTAGEPSGQLAPPSIPSPSIPPLAVAPASTEPQPAASPPPPRREPLPLQTDLLPMERPGPASGGKPNPDRHG